MKANIPTRKKIKLNWFKAKADLNIDRKIDIQYNSVNITSNKLNWDVIVKYILIKEGVPKEIPINSPITLYKEGLPFLFLSTANTIGNKTISEDLIDDDIKVDDDIIQIKEGETKVTYEDAKDPKEHIEVRTRYDNITRRITIENKLDNSIELLLKYKQTKDVNFVSSTPEPNKIEEPEYHYNIIISSENKFRLTVELKAKMVSRVTKLKPEFLKKTK
jgi:hypothetical protein